MKNNKILIPVIIVLFIGIALNIVIKNSGINNAEDLSVYIPIIFIVTVYLGFVIYIIKRK